MGKNVLIQKHKIFIPTEQQKTFAHNFAHDMPARIRGNFDGDPFDRFVGSLGQKILLDLFHLPDPENKFDQGVDLRYRIKALDVKSMHIRFNYDADRVMFLIHEPQLKYENDGFLFMAFVVPRDLFYFGGFLPKEDVYRKGIYLEKGEIARNSAGSDFEISGNCYQIFGRSLLDFIDEGEGPSFPMETRRMYV